MKTNFIKKYTCYQVSDTKFTIAQTLLYLNKGATAQNHFKSKSRGPFKGVSPGGNRETH